MLGIGGVRALRAAGYDPMLFHLNEGHSFLANLELVRETVGNGHPWRRLEKPSANAASSPPTRRSRRAATTSMKPW